MSRNTDSEEIQAQYRGGCGADSIADEKYIPDSIPVESFVLEDGEETPFPENPKKAIPDNESIRDLSVDEIIAYLSETIPEFAARLETEYLDELQQVTGESADMLRQDIDMIHQLADPSMLRNWLTTGDTDLEEYLEGWQQADGYVETVNPVGRGININAGHNVGAAIIPELWRAVTKNAVLHKMPSTDQLTLRVLEEVYAENPHPVSESFAAAYWPGGNEQLERSLFSADYVMAWGDDTTIQAIQRRVEPTTRFVPFHFEFGVYMVDRKTQEDYGRDILEAIAADFSWGDQLLCFSPLVMVVEESDSTERFLSDLAAVLEEYTEGYEPGVVPEEEEMKITRTKRMARDYGQLVSDWENKTTVLLRDGFDRSDIAEFHSFRFVEAHTVSRLEEAVEVAGANENLQEFILATTQERGDKLRDQIQHTNAKRIVSPGGAPPTNAIPWDGNNPTSELVKWVSDER